MDYQPVLGGSSDLMAVLNSRRAAKIAYYKRPCFNCTETLDGIECLFPLNVPESHELPDENFGIRPRE